MLQHRKIEGALVELPARGLKRPLDGFWAHRKRRSHTLAVFVHGMHSNFYRSAFKKELMRLGPARGIDVLSFNNRGAEQGTCDEVFEHCRFDLDAALAFGRAEGYTQFVLIGHSTGCQKIAYYFRLRRPDDVAALVFSAPGDDYAIARRQLGGLFAAAVRRARRMAQSGRGRETLVMNGKPAFMGFSARRFLSIADPRRIEARLFLLDGPLRELASIRVPALAVLPAREEYACIPVPEMARRLAEAMRANPAFEVAIVPQANHGFKGVEREAADAIWSWLARILR